MREGTTYGGVGAAQGIVNAAMRRQRGSSGHVATFEAVGAHLIPNMRDSLQDHNFRVLTFMDRFGKRPQILAEHSCLREIERFNALAKVIAEKRSCAGHII